MKQYNICLAKVPQPPKDCTGEPVMLTDATVQERLNKVLQGMKERSLEQLVVYGDAEHCGNFQYLMGYFTRFEESLLVLDADGAARFVLGNENLNKASKARIPGQAVHVSLFSLPNQPTARISRYAPAGRGGIARAAASALRDGSTLQARWKITKNSSISRRLSWMQSVPLPVAMTICSMPVTCSWGRVVPVPPTTPMRLRTTSTERRWLQTVCWMQ